MTEEEYFRKNYPDSCYGDKPLSPHFDFFQDGVEFGERECEKKIQELEAKYYSVGEIAHHRGMCCISALRENRELEKENAELKKSCDETQELLDKQIEATYKLDKENAELKEKYVKNICDCDICDTYCNSQLIKAKEIIRELLSSCFGYNSKTVNYEVKAKAEHFLKEVEE